MRSPIQLQKNMKPFTDGDFVKDCLMAVVEVVCPEKKNHFAFLLELSTQRIVEDVKTRQQDCLKKFAILFNCYWQEH